MLIFVVEEKSHVVDWETHRTKLKTEATLSSNGGLPRPSGPLSSNGGLPRPSGLLAYGEQSRLQRGRGSQILFFGVFA